MPFFTCLREDKNTQKNFAELMFIMPQMTNLLREQDRNMKPRTRGSISGRNGSEFPAYSPIFGDHRLGKAAFGMGHAVTEQGF